MPGKQHQLKLITKLSLNSIIISMVAFLIGYIGHYLIYIVSFFLSIVALGLAIVGSTKIKSDNKLVIIIALAASLFVFGIYSIAMLHMV